MSKGGISVISALIIPILIFNYVPIQYTQRDLIKVLYYIYVVL